MRYDVPIYDPFGVRGEDFYHPANDAASHLFQIALTYDDVARLLRLLKQVEDQHDRKLLTKYAILEVLSLDDHLSKLVGLVLSGRAGYPVSHTEAENIKKLNSGYTRERKALEPTFRQIRNRVGAHRDPQNLIETSRLWDQVDAATVVAFVGAVPDLYKGLQDLKIYHYTKTETDERGQRVSYVAPMVWGDPSD